MRREIEREGGSERERERELEDEERNEREGKGKRERNNEENNKNADEILDGTPLKSGEYDWNPTGRGTGAVEEEQEPEIWSNSHQSKEEVLRQRIDKQGWLFYNILTFVIIIYN